MKAKQQPHTGVQELCRKLKIQLDDLAVEIKQAPATEEEVRRTKLMEQLKQQLVEFS